VTARDIVRTVRESGAYFTLIDDGFTLRNAKRVPPAIVDQLRAHRDDVHVQLLLAYAHALPPERAR
jgi:hypothetical protein